MNKKIKIGVMGCASVAERSVIPAILQHADFELVAIASRTLEKAEKFAQNFNCKALEGYENLLAQDIDVVYIPLPMGLHQDWITKCLLAKKHVFVEKSFGMNYEATKELLAIAEQQKVVAMENFMFLHHSQHAFLMQLIKQGEIGSIKNFKAYFGFPPLASNNFRYNKLVGGGSLLDAGAYTVKAMQAILGPNLELLSATILTQIENDIDISGSAHFIANKQTPVHLAWGFDNFYQCGLEIWGTKGKITTNRTFTAPIDFSPTLKLETESGITEYNLPADNHFYNTLSELANKIRNSQYLQAANEVRLQSLLLSEIAEKAVLCKIKQ